MSADPADLANLRDLAVPPAVSWWLPAPGWWVLAAASLMAGTIVLLRMVARYRADAYRRAALRDLTAFERIAGTLADPVFAGHVFEVLKRVALVAYPRDTVAALSGPAWLAFLDRSAATTDFSGETGRAALNAAFCGAPQLTDAQRRSLVAAAGAWVRNHRPAPTAASPPPC